MKYLILVVILIGLYGGYEFMRTQKYISIGENLADNAMAYEQEGDEGGKKVLILGDSSAVGTGAREADFSVAGYLGSDFSDVEIVNKAVNGYKTQDVVDLLQEEELESYDLIMLQIGGNDIVRLVDLEMMEKNLREILGELTELSEKIVVFHGGNVGTSKLFPWFVRPYYTYRTKKVRDMYVDVVADIDEVEYVDMFRELEEDPFYLDPEKYYADDFFHPSGAGYRDWYDLMREQVELGW